jgi:predicted ferric reductase
VSISVLDICAYVGLAAVGAVAFNMTLGMLMAIRYSPVRSWPHRRFNYFQLHNWSGYVALTAAILHPLILLVNKPTRFRVVDVVYRYTRRASRSKTLLAPSHCTRLPSW